MTDLDKNKQVIQNFVQVVWNGRNLTALKDFWTDNCINHAMSSTENCGIDALRVYHESLSQIRRTLIKFILQAKL